MRPLIALFSLVLAAVPMPGQSQTGMLALYQDRGDGTTRLHDILLDTPVGAALTDCCRTVQGTLTFDPATREILLVQQNTGDGQSIVRISAASGTVLGQATLAAGWRMLAAAYDRTRASLFGIGRNATGDLHLVTLSPSTGAVSTVGAPLPAGLALVPSGHGLHPRRGQWHQLAYALPANGADQRVLTFDLNSGLQLADVPVAAPYTLSNLYFDEGSGHLLGLGRIGDADLETVLLWLQPGTGQVTPLVSSGINQCCAWAMGSLAAIAVEGIAASHFTNNVPAGTFLVFGADDGAVIGLLPPSPAWAIHGLVVDQTAFDGDYLFYDGFDRVGKPASFALPTF